MLLRHTPVRDIEVRLPLHLAGRHQQQEQQKQVFHHRIATWVGIRTL